MVTKLISATASTATIGVDNEDYTYHDDSGTARGYCKAAAIDATLATPAAFLSAEGAIPRITLTNIAVNN